jgi:protein phosphatase 2C family protein 2/3
MNKVAPSTAGTGELTLTAGSHRVKGGRDHQEDRLTIVNDFNTLIPEGMRDDTPRSFYAVYDGHAGAQCAEYLKTNLHLFLARDPSIVADPVAALKATWIATDDAFQVLCRKKYERGGKSRFPRDGSTASVVLVVGATMYTCNTGRHARARMLCCSYL